MPVMRLETPEIESAPAPRYSAGGEVSALTLMQDVRAVGQRLDAMEATLRRVMARLEELSLPTGALGPAPDSMEALRASMLLELQSGLERQAKRASVTLSLLLMAVLVGVGVLGWMVHRLQ